MKETFINYSELCFDGTPPNLPLNKGRKRRFPPLSKGGRPSGRASLRRAGRGWVPGACVFILFVGSIFFTVSQTHAADFTQYKAFFASPFNQNFLPEGTLIKTATSNTVYYIQNGKKSMVLPRIISLWLQEAHYFKIDCVVVVSAADMARYPQTKSVNPFYIGKILQAPDKTQYFIDDKLRKRKISPAVRAALKFPGRNLYPTSSAHIAEFVTGPEIVRTDVHPGGTVMYNGAYHGGTVWRVEEKDGVYIKHYYLQDYIYEAEGYPWSGQIMSVTAQELARYKRGVNIERYPDGWQVGIGKDIFIVKNGALRRVASDTLYKAMGYNPKYILRVFPEFLLRYPRSSTIAGFKNIFVKSASVVSSVAVAPNTSSTLTKVRPAIRDLIAQINDIYMPIFDKQISVADNMFWIDYVYNGEVSTKSELVATMTKNKTTGIKPFLTPRTTPISLTLLRDKWFPYLFYFVFQREPDGADRDYWFGRINDSDRNTIEKLGGTMQWLKDTAGVSHK